MVYMHYVVTQVVPMDPSTSAPKGNQLQEVGLNKRGCPTRSQPHLVVSPLLLRPWQAAELPRGSLWGDFYGQAPPTFDLCVSYFFGGAFFQHK